MRLHALASLLLLATIALSQSTAAQETTPNEPQSLIGETEIAAPDVVTTGGESQQVTYENPVPEFLRGKELLPVLSGQKIVTIPVSSMNWLDLDSGDVVRVDLINKDFEGDAPDGGGVKADELTVTLVESARIYAISSFAPADTHAPVCLIVSADEARKCMESLSREGEFLLTVVEKQPQPTLDTLYEDPLDSSRDAAASGELAFEEGGAKPRAGGEWPVKLPPLSLEVDRSDLVTHDSRIKTVDGFDPSVIDVVSVDPRQIRVTARSAGNTTITLVDEHSVRNLVDVVVLDEHAELKEILRRLYPEASIEVIAVKDSILLRGTVVDGAQVEEIVEIVECFAPHVLNQLRTQDGRTPASETSGREIPAGMRVVTIQAPELSKIDRHLIKPGEQVGVVVSWGIGGSDAASYALAENLTVDSVDHKRPFAVSLIVTPEIAEALQIADEVCDVSLTLQEPNEDSKPTDCKLFEFPFEMLISFSSDTDAGERQDGSTARASGGPDRTLDNLREDLRALHDDVRQLIEILKQRENERAADPDYGAAALQTGVLFCQADWCGPCQKMWPIVARLIEEGRPLTSVDIERNRDLQRQHAIVSTPTFVFLKDGEEVHRHVGILTEEQLVALCDSHFAERRNADAMSTLIEKVIGLRLSALDDNPEELRGGPYRGGLRISSVTRDSPAEGAGLRAGDLLVGLDRSETTRLDDVSFVLHGVDAAVRRPLKFFVIRDGETLSGRIELDQAFLPQ